MEGLWWFAVLIGSGVYWTKNISLFLFSLDADKQRFDIHLTICIHSHGHSLPFAMFHVPYHRLHGTQMIYTLHRQNQRFFLLKIICRLWFEIRWFPVYFLRFLSITSNQITTIFRLTRFSLLFFLRFFLLFFNAVQQTFFNVWTRSVCSTDSVVSYGCKLELPTSTLNSVCVTNAYFPQKSVKHVENWNSSIFFCRPMKCVVDFVISITFNYRQNTFESSQF